MSPGPNRAPPLARKVTPLSVRPSSGRCFANPRGGDAESKVMVVSPRDADVKASRPSKRSRPACAAPHDARQSAAAATSAYSTALMRESLLKFAYSSSLAAARERVAPRGPKGKKGRDFKRPRPARGRTPGAALQG